MKSKIRVFLIVCGAILFSFSVVTEGCAAPPLGPRHPPRKVQPHKVSPKHRAPVYKKRIYVIAPLAVKPKPPTFQHIWIPRYRHPSGTYIGGYWRPPSRPGFTWVDGRWNEEGLWVFGYWKPLIEKPGYLWVPGYWDGTLWVDGYWRPAKKTGLIWVPAHYSSGGVWIKGHWK
jgi:hypothetical protein